MWNTTSTCGGTTCSVLTGTAILVWGEKRGGEGGHSHNVYVIESKGVITKLMELITGHV